MNENDMEKILKRLDAIEEQNHYIKCQLNSIMIVALLTLVLIALSWLLQVLDLRTAMKIGIFCLLGWAIALILGRDAKKKAEAVLQKKEKFMTKE